MQTLNRSISANYSGIMEHGACDALNRSHGARGARSTEFITCAVLQSHHLSAVNAAADG